MGVSKSSFSETSPTNSTLSETSQEKAARLQSSTVVDDGREEDYQGPRNLETVGTHQNRHIQRPKIHEVRHQAPEQRHSRSDPISDSTHNFQVCHQVPEHRLPRSDRIMEVCNLCYKTNWSIEDRCLFSASVLCVRPRNAEPIEAWSMKLEDVLGLVVVLRQV